MDDAAFVERVMAAVVAEPVPTPARTFAIALRNRSLGDAAAAIATAWHVATLRGGRIGPRARMRSLALVLSVVAVLAMGGSFATAAAVRVVEHARSNDLGTVVDRPVPPRQVAPASGQTDVEKAPAGDEVAEPDDPQAAPDQDADNATDEDEPTDADEDDGASASDESEDVDDHDSDEADEPDESEEADDDKATEDHEQPTSGDEAEGESEHEESDEADDGPEHEEADEAEDDSEHEESDEADDAEDAGEFEPAGTDGRTP